MRKTIIALGLACSAAAMAQQIKPAIPYDAKIESQVESTLSKMTLQDKIGQMCELTIDPITDYSSRDVFKLDREKMHEVFDKYRIGSVLNAPHTKAQKPQVWTELIRELDDYSAKSTGIPQIYGVDQIHGTTYTDGGTLFIQPVNQAASFNRSIPRRIGEICAYESRYCLIPWVYAPVMDLGRRPAWSRVWESFGEDPYLNSVMAREAVLGLQGNDPNHVGNYNVAACLKHYIAYGMPDSGKDRTPSSVPLRELREKFFEPFKTCAQAGALSIMVNSANNDGLPVHADHQLLTEWFKEGLNWDGMIVTDWADIENLCSRDHIAETQKDAVRIAINAGIDMSMVPSNTKFCDYLLELVKEGEVPMERIDDAVRRILRLKYRTGLFDRKTWDLDFKSLTKQYPLFGSAKHDQEAIQMAEEAMVLLKNTNGILPLKKGKKILVTGPNANSFRTMTGGWSYTWQGDKADEYCRRIGKFKTFYEAIADEYGKDNVTLCQGVTWAQVTDPKKSFEDDVEDIASAVKAAENADVIIAFLGENSYCETPGNTNDININANQKKLIQELHKTGKPVILVLNEGRARIISDIEPLADAVIDAFLPSNYGGFALANLISGKANFSAKMPFTYPKYINSLTTYDFKPGESVQTMDGAYNYDAKIEVLYEFGQGMSYTSYKYSNLKVDKTEFTVKDDLTFSVDVTNTGSVAGKEPVLLFVSDLVASITPDNKRLRGFEKVSLEPGETKTVKITIKASDLAFVGHDQKWVLEKGRFHARIGSESADLSCTETYKFKSDNREYEKF